MMFFTGTGAKEAVQISGVVEIEPDHLVIHAERSFIVVDDRPGPQNGWLYLYGLGEDHEPARTSPCPPQRSHRAPHQWLLADDALARGDILLWSL